MPRGGPKRLGIWGTVASVYPCLFAWAYWANEKRDGKDFARFKGVVLLTGSTWFPLVLTYATLARRSPHTNGFALLFWLYILGGFTTLYVVHRQLLIRKRVGLRFVERYDNMEFADQMRVQTLTLAAVILYLLACVGMVAWADASRPVPVIVTTIEQR